MSASLSHSDSDDQMSVSEVEEIKVEDAGVEDPSNWSVNNLQTKLNLRAARCSAAMFHPELDEKVLLTGLKFELVRKTLINYQLSLLIARVD
jgi:hypothetical protein